MSTNCIIMLVSLSFDCLHIVPFKQLTTGEIWQLTYIFSVANFPTHWTVKYDIPCSHKHLFLFSHHFLCLFLLIYTPARQQTLCMLKFVSKKEKNTIILVYTRSYLEGNYTLNFNRVFKILSLKCSGHFSSVKNKSKFDLTSSIFKSEKHTFQDSLKSQKSISRSVKWESCNILQFFVDVFFYYFFARVSQDKMPSKEDSLAWLPFWTNHTEVQFQDLQKQTLTQHLFCT